MAAEKLTFGRLKNLDYMLRSKQRTLRHTTQGKKVARFARDFFVGLPFRFAQDKKARASTNFKANGCRPKGRRYETRAIRISRWADCVPK